jgi:hypothetical protein
VGRQRPHPERTAWLRTRAAQDDDGNGSRLRFTREGHPAVGAGNRSIISCPTSG